MTLTLLSTASTAARLYNIMGWMSPVTSYIKMLLQTLWQHHIDWDEHIGLHLQQPLSALNHLLITFRTDTPHFSRPYWFLPGADALATTPGSSRQV